MRLPEIPRYGPGAAFYDVLSGEKPVYRVGRARAIDLLALREGDCVLDIGCGTGLNFPHLRARIGRAGHIVGVDASAAMLAQAERKVESWENVSLMNGDAGHLDDLISQWTFDAVISTYALSIIPGWRSAWAGALRHTRSGGRVAIVDLALPTGVGRMFDPAARFACFTGGGPSRSQAMDPSRGRARRRQRRVAPIGTRGGRRRHPSAARGRALTWSPQPGMIPDTRRVPRTWSKPR